MARNRVALFLLVTVAGLMLVPTTSAHAAPALTWSRCGTLECGTLTVPLDDATPDAGTVDIAVARRPATNPARRIGSLVVNPGGPGVPAIDFLRASFGSFPRALRERFDLVAFDPRGVGKSSQIVCADSLDPLFDESFSPRTDAERTALVTAARDVATECAQRSGALLAHVSTQATARDLDRLRVALGDERLSFIGSSYGSYLGALYVTLYRDRVRAIVLDGAIDPEQTAAEALVSQARGFEDELDAFLADCDARHECAFSAGRSSAGDAYDALRGRAAKAPIPAKGTDGRRLNETRFDAAVLETLYSGRSAWPGLADALARADRGDAADLLARADAFTWRKADGGQNHVLDAFWAISCLDGPEPGPLGAAGLERLAALSAARLGAFVANNSVICSVWPVAPVAPPPALDAAGAPTVLIVGATGDPATPLAAGRSMQRVLGNARLLVVDGYRHTSFLGGNECVDATVTSYLVDHALPARGARC